MGRNDFADTCILCGASDAWKVKQFFVCIYDPKVIRNAGGRITADVIRSLLVSPLTIGAEILGSLIHPKRDWALHISSSIMCCTGVRRPAGLRHDRRGAPHGLRGPGGRPRAQQAHGPDARAPGASAVCLDPPVARKTGVVCLVRRAVLRPPQGRVLCIPLQENNVPPRLSETRSNDR